MGSGDVPYPLFRSSDQTLPRTDRSHADGERAAVSTFLHLDQERASGSRSDDEGASARGSHVPRKREQRPLPGMMLFCVLSSLTRRG